MLFTFQLAERLGKTVAELETGVAQPLTSQELFMWTAYTMVDAHNKTEARKKAQQEAKKQQPSRAAARRRR